MLVSLIEWFDFMGVNPRLYHKEKFNHKSIFGGIVSLLVIMAIFSLSMYFLYIFSSRKSFTLYENDVKNSESTKSWGDDFSLILLDKYLNVLPDADRLFGIQASISTDKRIMQQNGSVISKTIVDPVNLSQCDISKWSNFPLWRDEKLINSSTCFSSNNTNLNSTGNFGATGYTGIIFWVHLCENDTSINKTDCFPINIIKERLDNVFVYVKFLNYYFNHESYRNHVIPFVYSELLQASASVYKRQWYQFEISEYISDNGLMFTMEDKQNVSVLGSTYNSIDLRMHTTINNTFFAVSLNMLDTKHQIHRSYYKVQNLLADLGGILKAVLILGEALTFIQSNLLYFQEVIDSNSNYGLLKNDIVRQSKLFKKGFYNSSKEQQQQENKHKQCLPYLMDEKGTLNMNHFSQGDLFTNSYTNIIAHPSFNISKMMMMNNRRKLNFDKQPLGFEKKNDEGRQSIRDVTKAPQKISLSIWFIINPMLFFAPKKYCHHKDMSVRIFSRMLSVIMKQLSITQIINSINRFENAEQFLIEKKRGNPFKQAVTEKEGYKQLKTVDGPLMMI